MFSHLLLLLSLLLRLLGLRRGHPLVTVPKGAVFISFFINVARGFRTPFEVDPHTVFPGAISFSPHTGA